MAGFVVIKVASIVPRGPAGELRDELVPGRLMQGMELAGLQIYWRCDGSTEHARTRNHRQESRNDRDRRPTGYSHYRSGVS